MIVRTVRGDVAPGELGPCDAHEHLFLVTPVQPGEDFTGVDEAIAEAQTLVDAGGGSLVDWTPLGLGRDLDGLGAVAAATGLHIVAATGLHRDAHYAPDDPLRAASEDSLAETFTLELNDRCGIIKAGASYHRLTAFEEKVFAAAAAAHAAVGAPVCVHTEHGTMGSASSSGSGDSACRRRRSCWRTSIATPTPASMPRPARRARGSSSTARAGRSTGPTRRSCS